MKKDLNNLIYDAKCKMAIKIGESIESTIGLTSQDLAIYTVILEKLQDRQQNVKAVAMTENEFKESLSRALANIIDDNENFEE